MGALTSMYKDLLFKASEYASDDEVLEMKTEFRNRRILSNIGASLVKLYCETRRDEQDYLKQKLMGG